MGQSGSYLGQLISITGSTDEYHWTYNDEMKEIWSLQAHCDANQLSEVSATLSLLPFVFIMYLSRFFWLYYRIKYDLNIKIGYINHKF